MCLKACLWSMQRFFTSFPFFLIHQLPLIFLNIKGGAVWLQWWNQYIVLRGGTGGASFGLSYFILLCSTHGTKKWQGPLISLSGVLSGMFYNCAKCVFNNIWQEMFFVMAQWILHCPIRLLLADSTEITSFFFHPQYFKNGFRNTYCNSNAFFLSTLATKSFLPDVPLIIVLLLQSKWVKRSWQTCTLTVRRSSEPEKGWVQQMPHNLLSVCSNKSLWDWNVRNVDRFRTNMPWIQLVQQFASFLNIKEISLLNSE